MWKKTACEIDIISEWHRKHSKDKVRVWRKRGGRGRERTHVKTIGESMRQRNRDNVGECAEVEEHVTKKERACEEERERLHKRGYIRMTHREHVSEWQSM